MIKAPNFIKKMAAYQCQACKDNADKTVLVTAFCALMVSLLFTTVESMIYGKSFAHAGDIILCVAAFYYQMVVVNVCAIRNIKDEEVEKEGK